MKNLQRFEDCSAPYEAGEFISRGTARFSIISIRRSATTASATAPRRAAASTRASEKWSRSMRFFH
jgi:hypothetical protein